MPVRWRVRRRHARGVRQEERLSSHMPLRHSAGGIPEKLPPRTSTGAPDWRRWTLRSLKRGPCHTQQGSGSRTDPSTGCHRMSIDNVSGPPLSTRMQGLQPRIARAARESTPRAASVSKPSVLNGGFATPAAVGPTRAAPRTRQRDTGGAALCLKDTARHGGRVWAWWWGYGRSGSARRGGGPLAEGRNAPHRGRVAARGAAPRRRTHPNPGRHAV